jgi:hypothetical protein
MRICAPGREHDQKNECSAGAALPIKKLGGVNDNQLLKTSFKVGSSGCHGVKRKRCWLGSEGGAS